VRGRAAGRIAHRAGASVSDAAGARGRPLSRRRPGRRPRAQRLSERLGQPFIVENRPGAGSNIGTEAVVRAPADGYTLLLITSTNAINTTLYAKLNFNSSVTSRLLRGSCVCQRPCS
jgi:hypothetical protein